MIKGIATSWLLIAVVASISNAVLAADLDLSEDTDLTRPPDECPYITFIPASEVFPDRPGAGAAAVDIKIQRDLENIYTSGLESAGFRRVSSEDNPAFFLSMLLNTTQLHKSVVHGTISLTTMSNTHRDYTFAMLDGALQQPRHYLGVDQVIEVLIEDDGVADSFRGVVEANSRRMGSEAWAMSSKTILALCNWRVGLARDELAIEDLREELVREMVEVRRRARQRKKLKLQIGPEDIQ